MDIESLYSAPAFIVNLDRCKERWESSRQRASAAGFRDVRRWQAVDAANPEILAAEWAARTNKNNFDPCDPDFVNFPGKQGVYLSMTNLWLHMIDNQIPFATIFEDDIKYHEQWSELAPVYLNATPAGWDMLFMGNQIDCAPGPYHICQLPVYCLHAYVITLEGARKMLALFGRVKPRTIDCILLDTMKLPKDTRPFTHYVWNGTLFPTSELNTSVIRRRNTGLVFQDAGFESNIQPFN